MKMMFNDLNTARLRVFNVSIGLMMAFLLFSCGSDSDAAPSDLAVNVVITGADATNPNGDGSGEIMVTASAKNAARYGFRFEGGQTIESTDGYAEHIVSKVGTHSYAVTVFAYSGSGASANKTVYVEVFKDGEVNSGLVFSDEFEYEGRPDPEKWHHQVIPIQNGSWANGELQHYTDRQDNSYVSDGTLKIVAKKEQYTAYGSTKAYTSARLNSKFAFKYGRVEFRAKLPQEAGTWPALWTLGANINEVGNFFGTQYGSVGWPRCGEIDVMEQKGDNKQETIGYFHWEDFATGQYNSTGGSLPVSNTSSEFHVYSMEWNENFIKIFVDNQLVTQLPNDSNKPYNAPHYLLINIAMGGNLGGFVPSSFTEGVMEVDYVRVYQ